MGCLLISICLTAAAAVVPAFSRIGGLTAPNGIQALVDGGFLTSKVATSFDRWSTVYIGLWRWCLEYGDSARSYLCANTSGDQIPAFARSKCAGHFYAARHLNWISAVVLCIALLLCALCFMKCSKWVAGSYWKAPKAPAAAAIVTIVIGFGLSIACWVCWIVLVEEGCRSRAVAWDPIQGYSTSFIFMCWATGFAIFGFLLALMGFSKLNKVPEYSYSNDQVAIVEEVQPVTYLEEAPVSYVTAPAY